MSFTGLIRNAALRCLLPALLPAMVVAAPIQTAPVEFRTLPAEGASSEAAVAVLRTSASRMAPVPTTLADVETWSEALTNTLRRNGFPVGQVLMTEEAWQATRQGQTPLFTVFPGRISGIRLDNQTRMKDAPLNRLATKAMCGTEPVAGTCLLQTARLERTTQLLQDLPGVAIGKAPEFSPGAGVGDIDVLFTLVEQGKPFTGDVFFDNKGIESTGLVQLGVTASGNNFLGMGESYALTLTGTEKRMWTGSLTGSVPVFDDGLRLTAGFTRQQYSINAATRLTGVANTAQAGLRYPITRGLDSNIWIGGSYLHSWTKVEFPILGSAAHSTLDALRVSLQANNGDRAQQLRSNIWSGEVALTAGHQSNDNTFYNAVTQVAGNYAKLTGSGFGTYGLNWGGDLFLMGQFNGQYASKNLDPSEKLGVGGPNAVRAYRADEGSFDDGVIVKAGLYKRIPVATGHQIQLGVFSDFAVGRVNHNPWNGWASSYVGIHDISNRRVLSGYGVGIDWLTPFGATLSASVSKAYGFASASWVDRGNKPVQYWLSLTWGR
ncbi:ShlB/FhaC/HecB family hemolysin secretion/activation protein [Cupriavidus agavae]|uniref:Hemolysin activation/secretion protein n=1 Tax=Cupriavidus agavae TaxID=1001822 RepID=A0A4Q7REX7_9BURK|nr:ShlB/FhaC/HecB family hemolysin secretion/activation protein [Cupriavidus agavae]RZT31775.1 hemolysin activation/secretion protein [Cupriavidus agavae]